MKAAQLVKFGLAEKIFLTGTLSYWSDLSELDKSRTKLTAYTRSDACGAGQMWAEFLEKNQEDLRGIGVFGDPGMADAVRNDVSGIGFNNIVYAYNVETRHCYEGLTVLPIDLDENRLADSAERCCANLDQMVQAISGGWYPSPPARDLYFISKGKPENPVIKVFLKWVLEEGQLYLDKAGYVALDTLFITKQIEALGL